MKRFGEIIKILKEIYPGYLVLLVFIPVFLGFLIDPELADSRYILINLLWIPIFTIPNSLLHNKIIYFVTTTLFFLIGLIEISHWIILRGPITLTSLLVISNTNVEEAIGFLNLKASIELLILIPYIFIYIISFRMAPKQYLLKVKPYILGLVALISVIFISENAFHGRFIRKSTPQIVKVTYSFITQINLYKEAMQQITPRNVIANTDSNAIRQTFILILGESCNRRHMSLYGASRKTNPKLELRKDLIVYTNVISPYSNTLNSVLSMLSNSSLERKISFEKSIDIIDIFHSAGFKTYWISNQSPIGIWDNLVTVFSKKSDYTKYVNTSGNTSFEATLTTSYDSKLFKPFSAILDEDVPRKFIVLHLMGSHSSYSKRYPSEFDVFKGKTSKEKTRAEYDNSIVYNDFIVDSLLKIVISKLALQKDSRTTVIYLSDHGENVYDEQDRVGHDYSNKLPRANVEVPFIVWLSPIFKKMNPGKTEIIRSNINKPFVSDDLFHAIMDLNNIQSPYLDIEKSIFSSKFKQRHQRILEDGLDYDKK
jgi:heptose-I-phosphate ethanolaminephosphotransferase